MLPGLAAMILGVEASSGIQLVGYTTKSGTGSMSLTSLTGGIASAPAEGDIVVIAVMSAATSNQSLSIYSPTGYIELADLYADGSAYDTNLGVYGKVQTSTPDTSIYIPANVTIAVAAVFRGINTSTPTDATTKTATGGGSATPNPPSITTVTPRACVVAIGAAGGDEPSLSVPSGYTICGNITNSSTGAVCLAYKLIATPGAEDPGSFTNTANFSPFSWAAATVALKPA